MEKEKEKIQELVNKMAANLLEQGIILSEAVKKQVCEDLCKDASSSIRAEQRTLVKREVGLLFSGLEKHFDFLFKESVKCNVEQSVLADVGLLDGKKSSDVEQEVSASDTGDEHAVEVDENHAPVEAEKDEVRSGSSVELLEEEKLNEASLEATSTTETEETQVSVEDEKAEVRSGSLSEETQVSDEDEKEAAEQPALVEEAKSPVKTEIEKPRAKLLAESRSQKPWTKRCDDPEIIRKVNEIIAEHKGIDGENFSRDADLRDDLGMDSLDLMEMVTDILQKFSITLPDDVHADIRTVGDAYNAVAFCLR